MTKKPQQRVVAYIDPQTYRKVKAKLALRGETFSSWIRKQVDKLLDA